ncbi:MAG: thioredoxin [Gammaproteobacteria bacterium]|nr:thioredoxin [Gammaproteobacteria bacterium]
MSDSPYIFEGTPENFEAEVIQKSSEIPVLVDFWASWCNPCQMLMPIVTMLAEEYQGKFHLVKVNSDEQQALASQYGVRSLPTLKLFRHGEVVEEIMGAQPESALRQLLDQYVEAEENPLVTQAQQLLEQGKPEEARKLMEQALEEQPDNQQIAMDLIRLVAMMGDNDAADAMISALPIDLRNSPDVNELRAQILFAKVISDSPGPAELETSIANNPDDLTSRYQLAAWRALEGQHEAALIQLLEIMKKDRSWQDDAGRNGMLAMFDLIPGQPELVGKYRRQMFNLLH